MAPSSAKRKRPDRQYSHDDSSRPSPHRPENLGMAQHSQNSPRGGYGGRGGRGSRRGSHTASNGPHASQVVRPQDSQEQISRPAPSAPTIAPAPVYTPPELTEDAPEEPLAVYAYEYLTDEIVNSWKESGRQELLEGVATQDFLQIGGLVQELIRAGLDKRIGAADAAEFIREMINQGKEDIDVAEIFIDTISLLDEKDQKRRSLALIAARTEIDPERMRHALDVPLLQHLSLVRNTFDRMRTRKTTNVLYRQANFNLLREESEGYAKLMTDYYNTCFNAPEEPDARIAQDAFHRIMALIGAFDLDVGRVLDITLDISANLLVKAYRFIMKFYRCSSWWPEDVGVDTIEWAREGPPNLPRWAEPDVDRWTLNETELEEIQSSRSKRDVAFFEELRRIGIDAFSEIGARKIINFGSVRSLLEKEEALEPDARGRDIKEDQKRRINENRRYMKATRLLPPPGNPDAAQLLGFKLRHYASPHRGKNETLHPNLMYLAALLIRIGFISLRDLYPHLYPSDEEMEKVKDRMEVDKQERDRKERPGAGMNALTMAGALADDTVPAVRNLKADVSKSGGSSPAPDKKDDDKANEPPEPENQKILLLKGLLAIGALPESLYILGKFPWIVDLDPDLSKYLHRILNHMFSGLVPLVQPLAGQDDVRETRLQIIDTVAGSDGIFQQVPRPGVRVRRHLGLESGETGDGAEDRHYYPDWTDNIPVCRTMEDFWTICNTFMNYVGLKVGQDVQLMTTLIRLARNGLREDSSIPNTNRWLDLIRRILLPALSLTKHNPNITHELFELLSTFPITTRFKLYGDWYFGKTSRLPDIKSAFEKNRAEVKDVLRRITNESGKKQARALAKVAFSSPGIVMMTFINQLESYSNMIPGLVDSVRYFNPLANDVLIWVLIRSLSGQGRDRMQADGMLTSAWLQALSQFVASLFTRYSKINASPVLQYVASELRKGESTNLELIDQVITEMAGIRSDMNFNDTQVKAMFGKDVLQNMVLQQLGDVRHQRRSSAKRLMQALSEPGIVAQILISIAQESQMYSHRDNAKFMPLKVLGNNLDKIQQVLAQYLDMLKSNTTPEEFEQLMPDVTELIRDFGLEPSLAYSITRHVILHQLGDLRIKQAVPLDQDADTPMEDSSAAEAESTSNLDTTTSHPVIKALVQSLSSLEGGLSQRVALPFYVVFWTFGPQQIHKSDVYKPEVERLEDERRAVLRDRSDMSATAVKEREKKSAALETMHKQLVAEVSSVTDQLTIAKRFVNTQKKDWFEVTHDSEVMAERHLYLLQECFLPRALVSAVDAKYSWEFVKMLHSMNTPGFSMMSLLEQLYHKSMLAAIIFQCTAREAENFGRFLLDSLDTLGKWHASKATYEKEAMGLTKSLGGFATAIDDTGKPTSFVEFEDFRRTLFAWHNAIKDAFKMCFESEEYMHIRNGIIVLKSVCTVFPALRFHGKAMQDAVKAISEKDTRGDLKLAALSLQGPLKSREKAWVIPQDFKMSDTKEPLANGQTNGDNDVSDSKLNAEAPDFKPGGSDDARDSAVQVSAEDGEIEDEKEKESKDEDVTMTEAGPEAQPLSADPATVESSKPAKVETSTQKDVDQAQNDAATSRPPNAHDNGKQAGRSDERYGRLERPGDRHADPPQSRSSNGRSRAQDSGPRDRRDERPPPRSQPSDVRLPRADDNRNSRVADRQTNGSSATSAHSDRSAAPRGEDVQARPVLNSSIEMSSVVSQPTVNPARAALINGDSRGDQSGDRRRDAKDRAPHEARREDGRSDNAPTGPRADRPTGNRELFEPGNGRGAPSETARGRLGRDVPSNSESSYGRLNSNQDSALSRPPSGPARGPRPAPNNVPPLNSRASESNVRPASRNTDAPPQRGPPVRADRPTTSSSTDRPTTAANSTPSTPAAEPAVHPSRLVNLGVPPKPTIDTNIPPQSGGATSPSVQPPSGPRAQGQGRRAPNTPSGPSPTNGVPTGPGAGERLRRGDRGRPGSAQASPATAVNNQGVQVRGAARQATSKGAADPPRAIASSMDPPPPADTPRIDPGRQSLIERTNQAAPDRGQRSSRNSSRDRAVDNSPRRPGQDYSYSRDDRAQREDRRPRDEDRRPPLMATGGSYQNGPPEWSQRPARGAYNDRREGPPPPPRAVGEEYRGPPDADPRKRRHDDTPAAFDNAKRRRSGR